MNGEISAMSISSALALIGTALFYETMVMAGEARGERRNLIRRLGGAAAVLGGFVLAVTARGWGVGLMSILAVLMLAMSALALVAPLWPQYARGTVGLIATLLFAHALGGS